MVGLVQLEALMEKPEKCLVCPNSVVAGENAQCLDEVNAAREAAALAKFTGAADDEKRLPTPSAELEEGWKKLCEYLIPVGSSWKSLVIHTNLSTISVFEHAVGPVLLSCMHFSDYRGQRRGESFRKSL